MDGQDFSFVEYWRASFSSLSVRGGSSASVYRLSIGEVLYAPRASLSPWWRIVFSSFKYVFLAAPYIKQPQSSLDLINERYNFNVSLLPPQLVCAIVLSNCMVLLHFVLKYFICGMKESLRSKMIPRYL